MSFKNEAQTGVEPVHDGFANRSVNHFATGPCLISESNLCMVSETACANRGGAFYHFATKPIKKTYNSKVSRC